MARSALTFQIAALLPLLDHAEAAPGQCLTFGDRFDKVVWKESALPDSDGMVEAENIDPTKVPPRLWLVKDHGAYMMSGGSPRQLREPGSESSLCVYAKDCDPSKDEDFYETARARCGGDDFVETFPTAGLREMIEKSPGAKTLRIRICSRSIAIEIK